LDGFWEEGLQPWDTAAGILILSEAGGRSTDYEGGPCTPFKNTIVATNGLLHDEMLELLT
jgi:myo-inositol-1(or 4)-monophosphatase